MHVFGHLLRKQPTLLLVLSRIAKHLMGPGAVTLPQCLTGTAIVIQNLSQKPLEGRAHQTRASNAGHVAEDIGGIQLLLVNLDFQQFGQRSGRIGDELLRQVILLEL